MSLLSRRARTGAAFVAVGVVAFVGGIAVSAAPPPVPAASAPEVKGGVLDEAAERIAEGASRPIDPSVLERAAVEGMLKALGDRWSSYYTPAEFDSFNAALEGRYTGVGLWVRSQLDGSFLVSSVQPSSPAAGAGLQVGDEVTSIGGNSVIGTSLGSVVAALRGSDGSTVVLGYRRGAHASTVKLTRAMLADHDVTVDQLRGGVLSLRIAAFTRGVGRQVRDALASGGDHRGGVVLDLRGNPGGLVDEAVEVASAFLDGGPVVSYVQRGTGLKVLNALSTGDTKTPLVILVDGETASAAEIVTAALQDRGRAVVVGSRTFGKGSVQEPTTLSDGSALEFTVGRYFTPSGKVIDGVGVSPDISIDPSSAPKVAERRALEVLGGLLAALTTNGRG